MNLTVELWQLVSLLLGFFGAIWAGAKVFFSQNQRSLDVLFEALGKRLDSLEEHTKADGAQWQRVERELNELKVKMPNEYVRRDDYIRSHSVIEAKLDALAEKSERLLTQVMMSLKGEKK